MVQGTSYMEEIFLELQRELEHARSPPLSQEEMMLPRLAELIPLFVRNDSLHGILVKLVPPEGYPKFLAFPGSLNAAIDAQSLGGRSARCGEGTRHKFRSN